MLMEMVCMHLEKNSESPKELYYYLLKYIYIFFSQESCLGLLLDKNNKMP